MTQKRKPHPLELKDDVEEAAKRWDAYYAGEMIDRPLVCVTAPKDRKAKLPPGPNYYDKIHGDLDKGLDNALVGAANCFYGGEAIPSFWMSFGADEVAAFCGGSELAFSEGSGHDTNWSKPVVERWEDFLPLHLHEDNPLWRRMLTYYRKAVDKLGGKMLLGHLDLHTNGDLLMALRSSERLCMDMIEQPEMIDRAMADARRVFREIWDKIAAAGRMDEFGYCNGVYSMEGASIVSCDFCCMISPEMFGRWILPAYEEEAAIVKHAFHHWDGPGALKHEKDILASKGLHTLGYVPTVGLGGRIKHIDCLDMLKRWQKGGKAVQACGTPEECKAMHKELDPRKVVYCTGCDTVDEAKRLLEWFVKNT